ncbi:unnamed protein product [Triticum turgidum subsp. durum]|uniref:BHLH domain-containing protein n=1 Tax=Triticum turgidum subsp. durum TaxID=4567 RepID=A0A9R0YMR4_TRITD|nr:unnamed protein product [Triticum turgidum subsp. durum]
MDPQEDGFFYSHHGACHADSSQGTECKAQSSVTARKVHKADRERMRRDKLNEQFMELGTTLGMMQQLVSCRKLHYCHS